MIRLVELVIVQVRTASVGIGIADDPLVFGELISFWIAGQREQCDNQGTNCSAQSTHTAKQQRNQVEQTLASSGNQSVLGHCSVPRIGLFAFDDSTNGGREMHRCLAQWASARNPGISRDKCHAVRY